jgi:hypothetical protein
MPLRYCHVMLTITQPQADTTERDRLRAQRERIARMYGHQPKLSEAEKAEANRG